MAIAASYVNATTLTVSGDLVAELLPDGLPGLAVRADCGADGFKYGHVVAATAVASSTTVILAGDALTANLAGIEHGNAGTRSVPCNPLLRGWKEAVVSLGAMTGSVSLDMRQGNVLTATLAGAASPVFVNPPAAGWGGGFVMHLTNGGAYTITWHSSVKWPGGVAPTLTAAGLDILVFQTLDGGTTWRGSIAARDVK